MLTTHKKRKQQETAERSSRPHRKIGLALGSGSARGSAHIGVLKELAALGIEPDIVAGTSAGALVGAAYAAGGLSLLEDFMRGLSSRDVMRYLNIRLLAGGGFADGRRLIDELRNMTGDRSFDELDKPLGIVATDLHRGREVWLRSGNVWDSVRASISLPGIMTPAKLEERWLVDGGLVNPVPVSLAFAMGADMVIAVNLNGDMLLSSSPSFNAGSGDPMGETGFLDKIGLGARGKSPVEPASGQSVPRVFEVINGSIAIMQDRITRSRMVGEPPDLLITPRLGSLGLMEFDRAAEAIEEGHRAVQEMRPRIEALFEHEFMSEPPAGRTQDSDT